MARSSFIPDSAHEGAIADAQFHGRPHSITHSVVQPVRQTWDADSRRSVPVSLADICHAAAESNPNLDPFFAFYERQFHDDGGLYA